MLIALLFWGASIVFCIAVALYLCRRIEVSGVRRWGAAALDLAYVACGRYEGYWERGINSWDVAAGILLVKEAGGFVESIRPDENPVESGSIVCGNPQLFDEFSGIIRQRD